MAEGGHTQASDNWKPPDDHLMGSRGDAEVSGSADDSRADQAAENADYPRSSSVDVSISGSKAELSYREKQVKVLRSFPLCCLPSVKMPAFSSLATSTLDLLTLVGYS
jgi:hypothetical protein